MGSEEFGQPLDLDGEAVRPGDLGAVLVAVNRKAVAD